MLKWLKQKPSGTGMTTEDPLATITVQNGPTTKISVKSSSSGGNRDEIYAVSRINPLFEEENLILPISANVIPGKPTVGSPEFLTNSGSSGYDSGDAEDEHCKENKLSNKPKLFSDQHDILIHSEASRLVREAKSQQQPVLHIVQQNPNYVQSIAVSVSPLKRSHGQNSRNLSPVPEAYTSVTPPRKRVQIPLRSGSSASKSGDVIGSAVMLQKSPQYVQSVRIGRGHREVERKPSVTFSEKVDILSNQRGGQSSRKSSTDHDSIVTDSLLHMMTSGNQLMVSQPGSKRFRSQIPPPPTTITAAQVHQSPIDLENFSNSLSKNRFVKQIVSRSSSGGGRGEESEYDLDEELSSSSPTVLPPRHRNPSNSAFNGIADQYAAAKEIAKEIQAYGNSSAPNSGLKGSNKKMSIVRDLLLSNRNRSNGNDGSSSLVLKTAIVQLRPVNSSQSQPLYVKGKHDKEESRKTPSRLYVHPQVPQVQLTPNGTSHLPQSHNHKVPVDYIEGQRQINRNQQQVPIYEVLTIPSQQAQHRGDDSDSGNSTDRGHNQNHKKDQSPSSRPPEPPRPPPPLPPNNTQSTPPKNSTKVMIVSGDSQNMLIDLSGVPEALRTAIISGTALMTLPDGLNQTLAPGYAMVPVSNSKQNDYEVLPSTPKSSTNARDGKDYDQIDIVSGKYGTQNKAHVWNMSLGAPLGHHSQKNSSSHNSKKFTTVNLPNHPNQDSHITADFTIEGQRLSKQTKRVKRLKTRRCVCRIFGIFLFLGAFVGVIVTLSLVYTKGKHYFGPV